MAYAAKSAARPFSSPEKRWNERREVGRNVNCPHPPWLCTGMAAPVGRMVKPSIPPTGATFCPLKNAPVNSGLDQGLVNQSSENKLEETDLPATCVTLVWNPGAISMRGPSCPSPWKLDRKSVV